MHYHSLAAILSLLIKLFVHPQLALTTLIMSEYGTIPANASLEISKFEVQTSDAELADLQTLLRLCLLGPKTYENLHSDGQYGVTYEWMSEAKTYWADSFDWYDCSLYITYELANPDAARYQASRRGTYQQCS